jgi:hypothetical protein
MNSRTLGLLLILCSWPCLGAIELIKQSPKELVLRLRTDAPKLVEVVIQGARYSRIAKGELQNEGAPGHPEIPTLSDLIWVPQGTKPVLTVHSVPSQILSLDSDLSYLESLPNHCGSATSPVKQNGPAYKKTYGIPSVEITETGFGASDKFARIKFWPFQYHPTKRQLFWAPEILVTVSFESEIEKDLPTVLNPNQSLAPYLALNPPQRKLTRSRNPVDLVISHPTYQSILSRYIDFKKLLGRDSRVYFVEKKTAEEIKNMIRKEYAEEIPPSSVLLVGNIDQIPSWKGSSDNRWTDFPYTTLDKDSLPDISLGRIPAHNSEELNYFIDKAIAREKEPRNSEEFLLTAGQDESLGCPQNVTKVGKKIIQGAPLVNLTKKYRTEVGTEEVISAYNSNPNIIVYDGHGNRAGMTEIPLLISTLNKLSNSAYPIILDIACLNANWSSSATPRNFAESILLAGNRGAAGIMASGGSGYGHDFFQTIGELIGKSHQRHQADPHMNEIGQVILGAKIKHGTQDRTYWNYYGDPSSSVF